MGVTLKLFGVSVQMLELVEQDTWNKVNVVCKVKSNPYHEYGRTRENEDDPMPEYPCHLDHHLPNLEGEIHLKGGRIVTP